MPGNWTLRKTYTDGQILSASDYVADLQQAIDNADPQHVGDYSTNLVQVRTITDHGDVGSESLASTLAGEIERLRYAIKHIKEKLYASPVGQWYDKGYSLVVPDGTITSVKIVDGSITNAKLAANSVTSDKIADGTIQTVDLADGCTAPQIINASNPGLVIGPTLLSQAITLTRTRVRVVGVAHCTVALLATGGLPTRTYTIGLYRDGNLLAQGSMAIKPTQTSNDGVWPFTVSLPYTDTPGAGAHTYELRMSAAGTVVGDLLGCAAGNVRFLLEEIA